MSIYNRENVNADQTPEEQDVQTMFLSEGTTLMVRMGFSNDIDSLERIFLGKIVAVEYGERIVVQAQSFGAELHEMINNGTSAKYGATSAMRTHGDILMYAMATTESLVHFGTKSVYEAMGYTDTYSSLGVGDKMNSVWEHIKKKNIFGVIVNYVPALAIYNKYGIFDPRLENVYLPISGNASAAVSIVTSAQRDIIDAFTFKTKELMAKYRGSKSSEETKTERSIKKDYNDSAKALNEGYGGWGMGAYLGTKSAIQQYQEMNADYMLFNATFDWAIPERYTIWQLAHEIKLYHDDYIVTVLPYNDNVPGQTRETLYVGPRNGYYKFTDAFDTHDNIEAFKKKRDNNRVLEAFLMNSSGTRQLKSNFANTLTLYRNISDGPSNWDKNQIRDIVKQHDNMMNMYRLLSNQIVRPYNTSDEPTDTSNGLNYDESIKSRLNNMVDLLSEENEPLILTKIATISKAGVHKGAITYFIDNPRDIIEFNDEGVIDSIHPAYKPVIQHHYVDSYSNIINNNIEASSDEIYNRLILTFNNDPKKDATQGKLFSEFIVNENIRPSLI
jgi:hypothetical protein